MWDIDPIYPSEKRVFFEFWEGNPILGLLLKQLNQHISQIVTHQSHHLIEDIFNINLFDICLESVVGVNLTIIERIFLKSELEHQHSDRPEVNTFSIVAVDGFRCSILKSAYKSRNKTFLLDDHL